MCYDCKIRSTSHKSKIPRFTMTSTRKRYRLRSVVDTHDSSATNHTILFLLNVFHFMNFLCEYHINSISMNSQKLILSRRQLMLYFNTYELF